MTRTRIQLQAAIGVGLIVALANTEAVAALPPIKMLSLPMSANMCLSVTPAADAVTLRSTCGNVRVLRCAFRSRPPVPVWNCDNVTVGSSNVRWSLADTNASGPTVYLGACRSGARECRARQDFLRAEADNRRQSDLDIGALEPVRPDRHECRATTLDGRCVATAERG